MAETQKLEDNDLIPAEIRSEMSRGSRGGSSEANAPPAQVAVEPVVPKEAPSDSVAEKKPDDKPEQPSSEPANEEVIDAFAESVMLGLEQAGLDEPVAKASEGVLSETISAEATSSETKSEADVIPLNGGFDHTQGSEAFFADWGSAEDVASVDITPIEDGSPIAELREEPFTHEHTLAEMALVNALDASPDESELSDPDIAIKHDALADAVQSALLSIYGDTDSEAQQGDDGESHGEEANWNAAAASAGSEFHDGLSPQDVILNYFSYEAEKAEQPSARPEAFRGRESSSETAFGHRFDARSAQQSTPHSEAQYPQASSRESSYTGPAAYPVPARPTPQPQSESSKRSGGRESGRLLGAAAIGLVGGIAIAATLAVFVISSYRPQPDRGNADSKSSLALRSGTADPAYGSAPDSVATAANTRPSEVVGELVASDVVVTPGQPIALSIKLNSTRPSEQTLISISGVPLGGRLNAGIDAGSGNWLLPPRRLNGLILSVPADAPTNIPLEVQLLDSNVRTPLSDKRAFAVLISKDGAPAGARSGERTETVAASVSGFSTQTLSAGLASAASVSGSAKPQPQPETQFKTQTVTASLTPVEPVAPSTTAPTMTPSGSQIASLPVPAPRGAVQQAEIEDLIREGNKRMREGDIVEARQFYTKAVNLGDAEAALAMGRSYDPIYFARIDKKNAEPDVAKAFDWYRKAMDSGATQTAKIRIENLQHFLNE